MAEQQSFMKVEEVAQELGISKSYAYKIVQKLNAELKSLGYLTISGRVNRKYFMEKLCYGGAERKDQHMAGSLPLHRLERRTQADAEAGIQNQTGSTGVGA